jgi:hypothetical protein
VVIIDAIGCANWELPASGKRWEEGDSVLFES